MFLKLRGPEKRDRPTRGALNVETMVSENMQEYTGHFVFLPL